MQWWCAAQGIPWTWQWRAYPGVWVFVGLLGLAYWRFTRNTPLRRSRLIAFACGLVTLWVALDWPVGALGAGYLASVHMVQFLLIALLAPPLLIAGLPRGALVRAASVRGVSRLRPLSAPLFTLLGFHAVIVVTHWPGVVDGLMGSQLGSMALDLSWLLGGMLFWWPIVSPLPHRPRFPFGVRIGYLILSTVLMTLPYVFLTFSDLPFYATYELAPPIGALSAGEDQRIAGVVMRLGAGTILWSAAGVVFWFWYRAESD